MMNMYHGRASTCLDVLSIMGLEACGTLICVGKKHRLFLPCL